MKKAILIITAFNIVLIGAQKSNAQAPENEFKKMASLPMPSPQAASLSKYVEFPVSYYNGLPQISLPVYEIVSGDITVPITLSYHGGGIKVQEEASWVGLGWTLNAGGVITHDIKGTDDEVGPNHVFNQVFPSDQRNNYSEFAMAQSKTGCPGLYTSAPALYNCGTLFTLLNGGNADGEPDMYVYNFGNYSGKFFSSTGQFVDLGRNNIIFTHLANTGFTARTPDGFTYTFHAIEKSWAYPTPHATNTAYYLTKITSPRGKVVTFTYKSFKTIIDERGWGSQYPNLSTALGNDGTVMQLPGYSEYYANHRFVSGSVPDAVAYVPAPPESTGFHQTYSSTTSSALYLDRITFDNGTVDFIKSPRTDLYGLKLDAINISRGTLVKSVPFSYGYFVSNTGDDDMYDPTRYKQFIDAFDGRVNYYPVSFRNQLLKLNSVMIDPSPHSFEYFDGDQYTTLPFKTSFKQDYWGYYNGRRGNRSLIPDYAKYSLIRSLPTELSSWKGADRTPDDAYIRAGSLKKITYPTGGFSYFSYEMNQYTNLSPEQMTVYREARYGGVDAGTGVKQFYFTLTTDTRVDILGGLYCNEMLDMNSPNYNCGCAFCGAPGPETLYASIVKVNPTTLAVIQSDPALQFDITKNDVRVAGGFISKPNYLLPAGTYCVNVNYPDNHNPPGNIPSNRRAELYVSFYEIVPGQTNSFAYGAGLRVKSIRHIDPVAPQITEKKFTYSVGRMMRFPVFTSDALMQYSQLYPTNPVASVYTADYRHYYLYSSPTFPYSFSANGSAIGYDIVTETMSGSTAFGKTQYEYKNRPDIVTGQPDVYLPGTPSNAYLDNGFLTRTAVFDKSNTLVKETLNQQVIVGTATYWPFKCRLYTNEISTYTFNSHLQMSFYPVQVGKLLTSRATVNDFANGTTISTVTDFKYNSSGLLILDSTRASDGSVLTTHYSYAGDYTGVTSGWIKDLRDKNMVGIPLQIYAKRNGLVTRGSFTTYLSHDNIINPDKVYKIETTTPKAIASTAPNGVIPSDLKLTGTLTFDANGNLVQSRAENDVYTSYLWGYNKSYPVAKVIGADYAAINTLLSNGTVNASVVNNLQTTDEQMRAQLNNLRNGLAGTRSLISTYTYSPLVGISSETDPKGLLTFYNYDNYNRLSAIRDYQNNVLKAFSYAYSPAVRNAGTSLYYNQSLSKVFAKQCTVDAFGRTQIGTEIPYTVTAEKYISTTQQAANDLAQAEIDANGQANANAQGYCYIYAGPLDLVSVQIVSPTQVTVTYRCPYNTDFLYLFIKDVATGVYVGNNGNPIQLSKGQTFYTISLTKGKQYKFSLLAGGQYYPGGNISSQEITLLLP